MLYPAGTEPVWLFPGAVPHLLRLVTGLTMVDCSWSLVNPEITNKSVTVHLHVLPNKSVTNIDQSCNCVTPKCNAYHSTGFDKEKFSALNKIVNIFLSIILSICFECSKEPSH